MEWSPSLANLQALAVALVDARCWEEALVVVRQGLRPKPPDRALLLLLARACAEVGETDEARSALEQLEARYPEYEEDARRTLAERLTD